MVEALVAVIIVASVAAAAVISLKAYARTVTLATCFASAQSIKASLITYAVTKNNGSFPRVNELQSWAALVNLCNANGSDLCPSAGQCGFQDWVSYSALDPDDDNATDDFVLLLRLADVDPKTEGAQLAISPRHIEKQSY